MSIVEKLLFFVPKKDVFYSLSHIAIGFDKKEIFCQHYTTKKVKKKQNVAEVALKLFFPFTQTLSTTKESSLTLENNPKSIGPLQKKKRNLIPK